MWLIAGLGNPGREYAGNRHNAGFMVADLLAERWGVAGFRAKFGGLLADARFAGERAVLLKPQQFMNCSGQVVAPKEEKVEEAAAVEGAVEGAEGAAAAPVEGAKPGEPGKPGEAKADGKPEDKRAAAKMAARVQAKADKAGGD